MGLCFCKSIEYEPAVEASTVRTQLPPMTCKLIYVTKASHSAMARAGYIPSDGTFAMAEEGGELGPRKISKGAGAGTESIVPGDIAVVLEGVASEGTDAFKHASYIQTYLANLAGVIESLICLSLQHYLRESSHCNDKHACTHALR